MQRGHRSEALFFRSWARGWDSLLGCERPPTPPGHRTPGSALGSAACSGGPGLGCPFLNLSFRGFLVKSAHCHACFTSDPVPGRRLTRSGGDFCRSSRTCREGLLKTPLCDKNQAQPPSWPHGAGRGGWLSGGGPEPREPALVRWPVPDARGGGRERVSGRKEQGSGEPCVFLKNRYKSRGLCLGLSIFAVSPF